MAKVAAVISVKGQDQKGVVARFATYLAECGINIDDLQQHVVRGMFVMDMLVDLADATNSLDQLIAGLLDVGQQTGMEVRVTLNSERKRKKIAVLVSKEPHCLEKIIEDHRAGLYRDAELALVLSNHDVLRPIAEGAGLEFRSMPSTDKASHMTWLRETMQQSGVDLVVLARYMQILNAEVVGAFEYQIINIHPSLLPHFPGPAPYRQAFEKGVRVSGSTAHFVTEDLDEGPIILQDVFTINVGKDSLEEVKRKGIELEAGVLSQAVRFFLNEELVVVDGCVVFKPGLNNLIEDVAAEEVEAVE
ncbi:MAG: formyltetrahydrofolate deformylase [Planctomycetota bacterium]|jgi:formyltetrahydrofolate deformylase